MVDELGGGVGVELGLGKHVGVADGHGAGGHGGEARAGAVAGAGHNAVGVLVHELLGGGLHEGLEGGGAVVGDLAHNARGGVGGTGGGGVGAAATGKAKAREGGKAAGETEEGAARAGIVVHGSPFESNKARHRADGMRGRSHPARGVSGFAPSVVRLAPYRALAARPLSPADSYGALTKHYRELRPRLHAAYIWPSLANPGSHGT